MHFYALLLGPNSSVGHTSVLFSIENSINLVLKVAAPVIRQEAADVEVKYDHEEEYCYKQQTALANRVWADCRYAT